MKETILDKSERLLLSGAVKQVQADVYWVQGDHGRYPVIIGEQIRFCGCESGLQAFKRNETPECSHVLAGIRKKIQKVTPRGMDPFEGIAGRLRGDGHR